MPYDAKKFAEYQKKKLESVKPYRKPKRIHDGWRELAGSIVYQAIIDLRAVRNNRLPPGSKDLGMEPWECHEQELLAYFKGDEFLVHCDLCGVNAYQILIHLGIEIPRIILGELPR